MVLLALVHPKITVSSLVEKVTAGPYGVMMAWPLALVRPSPARSRCTRPVPYE